MTPTLPTNYPFNDHPLVLNGHSYRVWSVALSPSHQLVASGSSDTNVRLWSTETGADIATLNGHLDKVFSLAFSPDGTMLASGSQDNSIKLWDVGSRQQVTTLKGHSSYVWSVAFSPDGATLVSASEDKTIQLWNVQSRTSISVLRGHSNNVYSAVFSPDGRKVASGSRDNTIRLWDVASRTTTQTLRGHSSVVRSVAFSPSGEYLASASYDKTIRLWSAATGEHIVTLKGHRNTIFSVAFSPNGKYLASGSEDKTIRLWDIASRSHILTLEGHLGSVKCLAFSSNGAQLASGAFDKTVRVWNTAPGEAESTQASVYMSDLVISTQNMTDSEQDAATVASTSVPLNNDISGLKENTLRIWNTPSTEAENTQAPLYMSDLVVSTQNTADSKQDPTAVASITVPLNNDISGSISLEGIKLIGFGGFGDVFSGVHNSHGKVALKRPRRLLDEALVRRFLREINLWCSVSHSNILACLGMCKIGDEVYVVSPFIENGDLLSCMARGMELNRSKLLFEVAEALTHLHHRGIVHGDVKAQNILIADDGSALLCDFGQAKAFDTMATSTESKGAGSVRWMAPELFLGEGRSMASDVYALGITIAEVLSGRAPYHEMTETLAVMLHVAYHDGRPAKEPMSSPEGKSYATLWETAEKCWVKEVKARPYMAQVLGMLFPLTRERN